VNEIPPNPPSRRPVGRRSEDRTLQIVTDAALAHLAIEPLLDDLLVRIRNAMRADTVVILLAEEGENELHAAAVLDFEEEITHRVRIPIGAGFAGKIAATGEPVIVEELEKADVVNDLLRKRGLKSLAGVPIPLDEEVIGVLHIGSVTPRTFSGAEIALLEDIAERIGLAVGRARVHLAEREARGRAEGLQAVTARLARAQSQQDVAEVLVGEGVNALGASAGWVAVLEAGAEELDMIAAVGYPPEMLDAYSRIRIDQAVGAADILAGKQTWLESADAVAAAYPAHAELYRRAGHEALAVIPLEIAGSVNGFLALNFAEPKVFPQAERDFVVALASICAQALERARLYDEQAEMANAAFVLAHVDDGVFRLDAEGVIRSWNPAAAHIVGLPATEAIGRRMAEVFGGWDAAAGAIEVADRPGVAGPRDAVPLELGGEERWLSISGVETPEGIVYAFRDLTAELGIENARREFLATASHELRTPLGAVYGAAQTLVHRELGEDQREEMLQMIVRECERLARIVDDLLLASRLDLDHVDVAADEADAVQLAEEVVSLRQQQGLPEGIRIVLASNGDEVRVACDRGRLRQVLLNLVDNAIKYSPSGGDVRIGVERDGSTVRLAVEDEGIGIPTSEQERVFEKFYRLDPQLTRGVGGSGLGLYISRELVRRMDGRIMLESEPGRGSRFTVELPAPA
jgi:PAS domain S-box-containing protein